MADFFAIFYFFQKVTVIFVTTFPDLQKISTRTNIKYISKIKKKH